MDNDEGHTRNAISANQVKAARALLGWTRDEAAANCGVGVATISRFERNIGVLAPRTLDDIVRGFSGKGIVFFNDDRGVGVALIGRSRVDQS